MKFKVPANPGISCSAMRKKLLLFLLLIVHGLFAQKKLKITDGLHSYSIVRYSHIGITMKGEPYRYAGYQRLNTIDSTAAANLYDVDSIGEHAMKVYRKDVRGNRIGRVILYDSIQSVTGCKMQENIVPCNYVGGGASIAFGLFGIGLGVRSVADPGAGDLEAAPIYMGIGAIFIWRGLVIIRQDRVRTYELRKGKYTVLADYKFQVN